MSLLQRIFGKKSTEVEFEEKLTRANRTYELYRAKDAVSARRFLESKNVDKKLYYIQVETPQGTWGVDVHGLYLVKLLPFQLKVSAADCEGAICGPPNPVSLQSAYKGMADNFVVTVRCGNCGHEWRDGIRYKDVTVVRCPECDSLNQVDSRPHIVHSHGTLSFSL